MPELGHEARSVLAHGNDTAVLGTPAESGAAGRVEAGAIDSAAGGAAGTVDAGVEDELLVEEISIDGMCGVY